MHCSATLATPPPRPYSHEQAERGGSNDRADEYYFCNKHVVSLTVAASSYDGEYVLLAAGDAAQQPRDYCEDE